MKGEKTMTRYNFTTATKMVKEAIEAEAQEVLLNWVNYETSDRLEADYIKGMLVQAGYKLKGSTTETALMFIQPQELWQAPLTEADIQDERDQSKYFDTIIRHDHKLLRYNSKTCTIDWLSFINGEADFLTLRNGTLYVPTRKTPEVIDAIGCDREDAQESLIAVLDMACDYWNREAMALAD